MQTSELNVKDLRKSAIKGSAWALLERISVQSSQFIVAVILARLLGPEDFGLIVLATIFSGIAAAICDGGFEKTIIQIQKVSAIQLDTIFFVNAAIGVFLTCTLYNAAPLVADFFSEPLLSPVLKIVSLGTTINALLQVQRTLVMRDMNFKKMSIAQMTGTIGGGIIGVSLALLGYGVWALALSNVATQILQLIIYWTNSEWYPRLKFSLNSIKPFIPFGMNILFSSILYFFIQQFSNLLIGRFYSGSQVGLVNRGSKTPELITGSVHSVIIKIAFPLFSRVSGNIEVFNETLQNTIQLLAGILFPSLLFIFANAESITVAVFGDQWLESAYFLKFFCIIKLLEPFVAFLKEIVISQGRGQTLSKALIMTTVVEVALLSVAVMLGINFVIWALLLSMLFQHLLITYFLSRKIPSFISNQLRWISPYVLLGALVAVSSYGFDYFTVELPIWVQFICKSMIAAIVFSVGMACLHDLRPASLSSRAKQILSGTNP